MTLTELRQGEGFRANDTYNRVRLLQSGGQGCCIVARSKVSGSLVVIKRVQMGYMSQLDRQRTQRRTILPIEASMLLSKLQPHPNILRLFATERDPSKHRLYLLYFEYCAGGDLLDQLRKFRDLKETTPAVFTLHVFVGLAYALAYVHEGLRHESGTKYIRGKNHEPIIHGDIKPDNVFLRWPGRQELGMPDVVLGDFGMAQVEAESWGTSGTPGYDSPEVLAVTKLQESDPAAYQRARNARVVTRKSDMYQLGLTIYLMAIGVHYKTGDDPQNIVLPKEYQNVVGLLSALIWCLQPEPEDRPECTGDVEEGLLFAVDVLMKQRDVMFEKYGPLRQDTWNVRNLKSLGGQT